jgi:hypothetical protein
VDAEPLGTVNSTGDPVATAEAFATEWTAAGYSLDFSLASLETEVDRLIELPTFGHGREGSATEAGQRNEAAFAAYIGEALRRLFGGAWAGSFYPGSPALNFYRSFVKFGDFQFSPNVFVSYRLTNGECEGSFRSYVRALIPRIEASDPDGDQLVG